MDTNLCDGSQKEHEADETECRHSCQHFQCGYSKRHGVLSIRAYVSPQL